MSLLIRLLHFKYCAEKYFSTKSRILYYFSGIKSLRATIGLLHQVSHRNHLLHQLQHLRHPIFITLLTSVDVPPRTPVDFAPLVKYFQVVCFKQVTYTRQSLVCHYCCSGHPEICLLPFLVRSLPFVECTLQPAWSADHETRNYRNQILPTSSRHPRTDIHFSSKTHPATIGFEKFLEAFAAVLEYTDYKSLLDSYCTSSAKCNRCAITCPVYMVTNSPRDIPCYRTNLLLSIYKRYFTIPGWLSSRIAGGFDLTPEIVDELADIMYRCTACRRCTQECPMGVDHGLITRLGRYILSLIGIVPKALQVSVREQLQGETHNTSKIPQKAMLNTLDFLSEEMEEMLGVKLDFPVDQPDRDFAFFCAVSDFLLEPETLMGNAAVLYCAGDWDKWTVGTGNFDGINYGLFYSDWHLENIIKQLLVEVERLKARNILIGECGHASRSAHQFVPMFGGPKPPPVVNFMEYTLDCLRQGKIELDTSVITERVTYHDPCNISRSGLDCRSTAGNPEILRSRLRGHGA